MRIKNTKPHYQHNCKKCHYLGHVVHDGDTRRYDLYVCESSGPRGSLIARYGNESPAYESTPLHHIANIQEGVQREPSYGAGRALITAYMRAMFLGFVDWS